MSEFISPNSREVISAYDPIERTSFYVEGTAATGAINVNASVGVTGGATEANQTNGSQKTQIVDVGGEAVTVTGGKLDVNASVDTTGLATSANQVTGNASLATIAGAVSGTEMQVDVLTMPTVTVQATNLDIRDLSAASDNVSIHGDVGVLSQLDLTNSNPATVAIVDASGNQITSFGGGTQYEQEDTTLPAIGTVAFGRYVDNPVTPYPDGALAPPLLDPYGRIRVQPENSILDVFSNAYSTDGGGLPGALGGIMTLGSDGSSARYIKVDTDGTTFTKGTVTANAGTDLNTSALALESGGNLEAIAGKDFATQTTLAAINTKLVSGTDIGDVTINNASGGAAVNIQDGGNSITIDQPTGSNLHTVVDSGTITTVSAVTAITNALPAGTNAIGKLAANSGVDIGDVDVASLPIAFNSGSTSATTQRVVLATDTTVPNVTGNIASDAVDSGNPIKVGVKAYSPDGTSPGTAVAEGDRTDAKGDLDGRVFVNTAHPRTLNFHSDGSSALTDASVAADPGDGFQIVITSIIFSTGSATACNIFFEEGSTKVMGPWYLEAVAGRGVTWIGHKFITPSTALTVTTSASIVQSLDVEYYIQAV